MDKRGWRCLIGRFSTGSLGSPSCETHLRKHLIFGRSTEQRDCDVQCRLLWKNFFWLWVEVVAETTACFLGDNVQSVRLYSFGERRVSCRCRCDFIWPLTAYVVASTFLHTPIKPPPVVILPPFGPQTITESSSRLASTSAC